MTLGELLSAMGRHKVIISLGVLLGVFVAVILSVQVGSHSGKPQLEMRSRTVYETVGVALIDTPEHASVSASSALSLQKPVQVAQTYAYMARSDAVMAQVVQATGPLRGTIKVEAPDYQPFIRITVQGSDPVYIRRVAIAVIESLADYIVAAQERAKIPTRERMVVSAIGSPSESVALQSRGWEIALIGFLLPVILFSGIALVLDRVKVAQQQEVASSETDHPAVIGQVRRG